MNGRAHEIEFEFDPRSTGTAPVIIVHAGSAADSFGFYPLAVERFSRVPRSGRRSAYSGTVLLGPAAEFDGLFTVGLYAIPPSFSGTVSDVTRANRGEGGGPDHWANLPAELGTSLAQLRVQRLT